MSNEAVLRAVQDLQPQFIEFKKNVDERLQKSNEHSQEIRDRLVALEQQENHRGGAEPSNSATPGALFVKNVSKESFEKFNRTGKVVVGDFFTKAAVTTVDVNTTSNAGVARGPSRRYFLRDLLSKAETTAGSIEYARLTNYVLGANTVAENTAKPESVPTYQSIIAKVKTIAHWIRITLQAFEDSAALQASINNLLLQGLVSREESYLLNDATEGLATLAVSTGALTGERPDRVRKAIEQIENAGYQSTGVVLNPADWSSIETLKGSDDHYLIPSAPQGQTQPNLWGVPVVSAPSMTLGSFLVGDFRVGATLFDRKNATVEASREDSDNFTKNLVTLLGEERAVLAVFDVNAFRKGSFA